MIVTKLIGGLGNQLFQYACGFNLARQHATEFKIYVEEFKNYKLHNFSLDKFNISSKLATPDDLKELEFIKEKTLNYDPNLVTLGSSLFIDGYWGSEKYFLNSRDLLLNEFSVLNQLKGENHFFSELIKNSNSVSLHIRRGDYIINSNADQILQTCSMDYYECAILYFKEQKNDFTFFIFTDDKNWVRDNFKIKEFKYFFVEHNDSEHNYEDLRLMSMCKHNIIANSTFSWWGAWLNKNSNKIIVAPQQWYTHKLQTLVVDLVPKNWIRL